MNLVLRLSPSSESGISITLCPHTEAGQADLFAGATKLVYAGFRKSGVTPKKGMTPEVLNYRTVQRIEDLEDIIEAAYNLLIDMQPDESMRDEYESVVADLARICRPERSA